MNHNLRLQNLRRLFDAAEIEALLVTQPENRYYLSGFGGSSGTLLVTPQAARLFTDFRYTERARTEAPDCEICEVKGDPLTALPAAIDELGLKQIGFEAEATFGDYRKLEQTLAGAGATVVPTEGLTASLRQVKDGDEIALIGQAVEITAAAFRHARDMMRPGITELALAWEIEKFMRDNGSQALAFPVIVAFGLNAAQPHAVPTGRSLNQGETVIIDTGARVGGYTADMTRTLCLGTPDAKFKEVYHLVAQAQAAAFKALAPGKTGAEIDAAAREVIREAGYGEAFGHGLGHGIGLVVHELPRLAAGAGELTEGMVFTLEPGVYLPGWGGVRIEDDAMLENGAARTFSTMGEI